MPERLQPKPGNCPPSAADSGGSGSGEPDEFGQHQVTVSSSDQAEAEETLLVRLVALNAQRAALAEQPGPATPGQLAKAFNGAQTKRVAELLQTLDALGQARVTDDGRFVSV